MSKGGEREVMSRMLLAPGRYVQGAGAIKEIGIHASRIGTRALVVGGKTALSLCGPDILASLAEQGIPLSVGTRYKKVHQR